MATPLEAIPVFCDLLAATPDLLIVFGARVRLLGWPIERSAVRHHIGRIFATAASLVLGIAIYDTQCGAKLFRTLPEIQALFQQSFATRWLFDVEILARWIQARRCANLPPIEEIVYEFPLHQCREVSGSKVRPGDFDKAFFGMAMIYWSYLRLHAQMAQNERAVTSG